MGPNRAFFLDKDGTLVEASGYPDIIPSDKLLRDHIIKGLKAIQDRDYHLFIVSNQPWIAKGRLTEEETHTIFKNVTAQLAAENILIKEYTFCPHQSSDNCPCKKPKTLLYEELAKKHSINIKESYFVGDMDADIEAGKKLGGRTILVLTGEGKRFENTAEADFILKDINEVETIL